MMETILQDLKFGIRMLLKNRGFTAAAVATLAIGVGANTAIFSIVNGVLLRPFPMRDTERLVMVRDTNLKRGWPSFASAPANYLDWRKQSTSFEDMAAAVTTTLTVTSNGEPERVRGVQVEPQMITMLGLPLAHGRTFAPEENAPGNNRVVILSHGLWQRRYGGEASAIGKNLTLDGMDRTVIGVLARDVTLFGADVWLPTPFSPEAATSRGGHFLTVFARLRPDKTLEEARTELETIAGRLEQEYPQTNDGWSVNVRPFYEVAVGDVRPALLLLLGAVGVVLLIASVNVANLMLARAAARQREIVVRVALGASRARLLRQFLTESLLLGALGGGFGVLLGSWIISAVVALQPPNIPRLSQVEMHGEVLLFALAVSLLSALLFGIAPAVQASRFSVHNTLKEAGRGTAGTSGLRRLRNGLVIAEVALSLSLLVGAGLLIKSYFVLQQVETGFDERGLLTVRLDLPQTRYSEPALQRAFVRDVLENLGGMAGVESAAGVDPLPLGSGDLIYSIEIVGRETDPTWQSPNYYVVTPDYFRTMRISLVRGRLFTRADNELAARVAIINETAARRFFAEQDPIGARITIGRDSSIVREVVGVVSDVKHYGLESANTAQVYEPVAQAPTGSITVIARTPGDPLAAAAAVKSQIWKVDRNLGLGDIRSMEQVVANSVARRRFSMALLVSFAAIAVLLAAIGVYGVLSYGVSQRTAEIGVRRALGAQQKDVLRLILGQGLKLTSLGTVVGVVGALIATGMLRHMLFGVEPRDPMVFVAVSVLLMAVALLASYLPARRAAKVDPMAALRYE